jgi:hypothetical protein
MSFFAMSFMGVAPFGSFFAGTLAGIIGPRETLLIGAACCCAGSLIFTRHLPVFREKVRPVYVNMGIIEGVVEKGEDAAENPPPADSK